MFSIALNSTYNVAVPIYSSRTLNAQDPRGDYFSFHNIHI